MKFDYDASDPNELSVLAKEVGIDRLKRKGKKRAFSFIQIVNIVDENETEGDWITIEKPHSKERGRIPRAYLRLDAVHS